LAPVAREQRIEPTAADVENIAHRRQIASDLIGQTDVGGEHLHQWLVQLAGVVELHRRDDQPFLMNLGRLRRPAARHAAADVHPVTGAGQQREQFAVGEIG
jgi:hypothetical protein